MNRFELEHMISLVDEKYIDEMFTDRIHNRKKNLFAGFGAVAAVLALILGIGFISGKINNDIDDIVANTATDNMLIDIIEEQVDYSIYFQNKLGDFNTNECVLELDGDSRFRFDIEYTKSILPVDTSYFTDGISELFLDYKDDVKYISISLLQVDKETGVGLKQCYIYISQKGNILSRVRFNNAVSQKRLGVDIYGMEFPSNDDRVLEMVFTSNDNDYMISCVNMSYDEAGAVMDAALRGSVTEDKFDRSKAFEVELSAVNAHISLADANTIEPFAGCIPQLDSMGDMQLGEEVIYYARRNDAKELVPEYISYKYNSDDKVINIQYFTEESYIKPSENIVDINSYSADMFSSFEKYDEIICTIDCDIFKINIEAYYCTADDIYGFTSAVEAEITGYGGGRILGSLSEANEIESFAGFIPQLDDIGGMTLMSCYYDNYLNGEEDIVIRYITPFMKFPYIQVIFKSIPEYGSLPETSLANYVTLEDLTENVVYDFADQAGQSGYEGCSFYSMTVDCGKFTVNINAECTPEELWTYLREIADAYDGSEIAYGGEHHRESEEVTLEYANEATAFSGFVPQNESIGELFVREVDYNKLEVNNKIVDSYLHIEYLPNTSYSSQYIITEYQQNLNVSDDDTIKIEELTEDIAKEAAGAATYPENNFYRFAINSGEFYIYIVAECPEETMREYLRAIIETSPKYTALTLEEAERNELTGGLVPQLDKIGDMTLEEGYCRIEEFDDDGIQFLRIKYRNIDFKYQKEEYDYYGKYISVVYTKKTGAITGASKFNDIESAINSIALNDSGVSKYVFGIDCGDFYIGVQALCNDTELQEYLDALKALETNMPQ